jgi:asparagine synthase (glutamine-hydrolysing)
MRYFVCLLDPSAQGISEATRRAFEALPRTRRLAFAWQSFDGAAVLRVWDEWHVDPLVVHDGDYVALGFVRLDNREELERWTESVGSCLTDLHLVLRLVVRTGAKHIRAILGDFAFVAWNRAERTAVAATDAFGVRKLFYAERQGLTAFASRAEALALPEKYDTQYFAERAAICTTTAGLTAYAGVSALPAATLATLHHKRLALQRYWSPDECEPTPRSNAIERDAPEILRGLLAESVRNRIANDTNTWAHLSGGLDSSAIVSTAQWLVERGTIPHGLAGTITYVDWEDTDADEREYAESVTRRWGVRNETIVDPPFWLDDDEIPPKLDQPVGLMAFQPRERRQCDIVRGAAGRVLLAGVGSDELFTGNTNYFADRLVQGQVWQTAREMARWAAMGRISFWSLAFGNAIYPLVPVRLRRPRAVVRGRLLPWVSPTAARRYGLRTRTPALAFSTGRLGHKYHDAMTAGINVAIAELEASAMGDVLEVRYPFLYRPIVEFALRLPPELCARPHARKWVLREAMRGILPEIVRTRVGKGASTDALIHSLSAQRSLLEPLVDDPMLADLGVIDATQLRNAFDRAPVEGNGDRNLGVDVQVTLSLEAWLRIRSGRWPQEQS